MQVSFALCDISVVLRYAVSSVFDIHKRSKRLVGLSKINYATVELNLATPIITVHNYMYNAYARRPSVWSHVITLAFYSLTFSYCLHIVTRFL